MKNDIYKLNQTLPNQQIGYQYEFNINVISIKIDYSSQFSFKIQIKRGNKQNEIDTIFKFDPYLDDNDEIPINEEFSIVSILNPKENSNFNFQTNRDFHEKKYKIYICLSTKAGYKPAIGGEINLSDYIDNNNENSLVLSNKTFEKIIIKYKVDCKYISEFDPMNLTNTIVEPENANSLQISKLNYLKNKKDNVQLEKSYVDTISMNRANSIFSCFPNESIINSCDDVNSIKSKALSNFNNTNKFVQLTSRENQSKKAIKNSSSDNKDNKGENILYENHFLYSNFQPVSNFIYKESDNLSLKTAASNPNEMLIENEKLKIELSKFKEYEIKISEEYQKLFRKYQGLEKEVLWSKETKNIINNSDCIKSNSLKEAEVDEINLEKQKKIIADLNNENMLQKNEIKVLKIALEELKTEKIKIFEEKSEIIELLKIENESINKQLSEQTRKSLLNESLMKSHEEEIKVYSDKIQILEYERIEVENKFKSDIGLLTEKLNEDLKALKQENEKLKNENINSLEKINEKFAKLLKEKELQMTEISLIFSNKESKFHLEKLSLEDEINLLKASIRALENKLALEQEELQLKQKNAQNEKISNITQELENSQKSIDIKESQIISLKHENQAISKKVLFLEEKIQSLINDKVNLIENISNAEKKLVTELNNYKEKLADKDKLIQSLMDQKEELKYENEKIKCELKNYEKNKFDDKEFFNQIQLIQQKAAEKEKKIIEEKELEIKKLSKDHENLKNQIKRNDIMQDKETKKFLSENNFYKQEIENLKAEIKELKEFKEKLFKAEKLAIELENKLIMKKVELSNKETEKEKLFSENKRLESTNFELKLKIENLENDLIFTKQKLGDVMIEMGEIENSNDTSDKPNIDDLELNFQLQQKKSALFFQKKK